VATKGRRDTFVESVGELRAEFVRGRFNRHAIVHIADAQRCRPRSGYSRLMVKLVYCIRRREDLSPEEFRRYWLDEHGPLVRKVAAAIGAVRYVQSHTAAPDLNELLRGSRGCEDPYDGITEVWWQSLADLEASMQTPESQEAQRSLLEDESTFIDFARSRVFMTEEHVIFDGDRPGSHDSRRAS
jgi:uncharacterized protein (TIGR02118 family)